MSVDGVNGRNNFNNPPVPTAPDTKPENKVLLVDQNGKPLIIKQNRKIGFKIK